MRNRTAIGRKPFVLTLLLALAAGLAQAGPATTTVILVRHAEAPKSGGDKDPSLSEAGRARAAALTHAVADAGAVAVFATQYRRTRETVRPVANALGLDVTVVPVEEVERSCRELAERLLSEFSGKVVLVAGHSNTVPVIIEALGAGPGPQIDHHQYDDLFVVTVGPQGARSLRLKYGEPAATPE